MPSSGGILYEPGATGRVSVPSRKRESLRVIGFGVYSEVLTLSSTCGLEYGSNQAWILPKRVPILQRACATCEHG